MNPSRRRPRHHLGLTGKDRRGVQTNETGRGFSLLCGNTSKWKHLGHFHKRVTCLSHGGEDITGQTSRGTRWLHFGPRSAHDRMLGIGLISLNNKCTWTSFVLPGPLIRYKNCHMTHGCNHHIPNKTHILEYSTVLSLDPKTWGTTIAFRTAVGPIPTHWFSN